jgi:hypothetical protein
MIEALRIDCVYADILIETATQASHQPNDHGGEPPSLRLIMQDERIVLNVRDPKGRWKEVGKGEANPGMQIVEILQRLEDIVAQDLHQLAVAGAVGKIDPIIAKVF